MLFMSINSQIREYFSIKCKLFQILHILDLFFNYYYLALIYSRTVKIQ